MKNLGVKSFSLFNIFQNIVNINYRFSQLMLIFACEGLKFA
jgi:hypothetical protein